MSEHDHESTNLNREPSESPVMVGNGGNGGGGGCIFIAIGPVEHSHTFHSVGGRIPVPLSLRFEMGVLEHGSDADVGTISVKIGDVEHSHRFKITDRLHFEFSLKQGHHKS
jgi:hypothetical protein